MKKNWCPWWHMFLEPTYHNRLHAIKFLKTGEP